MLTKAVMTYLSTKQPKKSGVETFQPAKLVEGFALFNHVLWAKRLVSAFWNIIIYGVIILIILGVGYYNGHSNKPVAINLGYGKEAIIELNKDGDYIHIEKNGAVYVKSKDGKILKQVSVKDIPNLQKVLSPFALELKPFVMVGGSYGTRDGQMQLEAGVGVQFARLWRVTLDAFITTFPAAYIGTSYQLTDNCFVGVAVGKSLRDFEDTRGIVYLKWRF